ncbi:CBN-HYLS-1 protein [Aphelenchoides avenae]|nr:CBN-HYLS-1 protein [Aphelenchus avenae]
MDELANVTDEELQEVLEDMGYHLGAQEFDDLKNLLRNLPQTEKEHPVAEGDTTFSHMVHELPEEKLDPPREELPTMLHELHEFNVTNSCHRTPRGRHRSEHLPFDDFSYEDEASDDEELQELIEKGYKTLEKIWTDILDTQKLLASSSSAQSDVSAAPRRRRGTYTIRREDLHQNDENAPPPPAAASAQTKPRSAVQPARRSAPPEEARSDGCGSAEMPEFLGPPEQRELWKQYREQNALRDVHCPAPGRVPYRHDPLKKLEHYKKEWAKISVPGEEARLALRWKIRDAMMKRDMPRVKFATRANKPTVREWIP